MRIKDDQIAALFVLAQQVDAKVNRVNSSSRMTATYFGRMHGARH